MYRAFLLSSLGLLSLAACGPGDLTLQASQAPCSDIDLDDPPDRDISTQADGAVTTVSVFPFFMECDAIFQPDIEVDGAVISVEESWQGEQGDCCFVASVGVKAERSDSEIEVQWFDTDGDEPAFAITVQTP